MNRKKQIIDPDRQFEGKLKYALSTGDITTFRRLVKGGIHVNSKHWYQSTLLHEAVTSGRPDFVTLLLQYKADVNAKNGEGRTALHLAARAGRTDIVKILLKNGIDIDAETKEGRTALHMAVWRGKQEVVQQLLEAGADVNIQDADGWTGLFWAAKLNYIEIAEALVQKGAILNCPVKISGRTPVSEALHNGHLVVAEYLLVHGADANIKPQDQHIGSALMKKDRLSASVVMETTDFLIQTGYDIRKDISYTKLPELFSNQEEFSSWVQVKQTSVLPLTSLCRIFLRKHLLKNTQGRSIYKTAGQLPMPKLLKNFVQFADRGNSFVT